MKIPQEELPVIENPQTEVNLLKAARLLDINVVSSHPLMGGYVTAQDLPQDVFKCQNSSARHLMFLKSLPSQNFVSTLVGQKQEENVLQNLEVIYHEPIPQQKFMEYVMSFSPEDPKVTEAADIAQKK